MTTIRARLKLKELPVIIETANGDEVTYTLRELDGMGRDAWMQHLHNKGQLPGVAGTEKKEKDFLKVQCRLVSLSLLDHERKPVAENIIQTWPHETVAFLFEEAQYLSKLAVRPSERKPDSEDSDEEQGPPKNE